MARVKKIETEVEKPKGIKTKAKVKKVKEVAAEVIGEEVFDDPAEGKEKDLIPQSNGGAFPFKNDKLETWAFWQDAFTIEECKKIIDIGERRRKLKAQIGGGLAGLNDPKVRRSDIVWLFPQDDMTWAFQKMSHYIHSLNERFFGFDLWGFTEGFQFTKYDSKEKGFYDMHVDRGMGMYTPRKLSITLQLSDPDDYVGGDLNLYFGKEPTPSKRTQGFLTVFPSYTMHEVTPVTKGTRYSLVAWITGPQFK